jgi:hypothetical protein
MRSKTDYENKAVTTEPLPSPASGGPVRPGQGPLAPGRPPDPLPDLPVEEEEPDEPVPGDEDEDDGVAPGVPVPPAPGSGP